MDNLVVNAVAPWEGYLHWLGNIREGDGNKGHWAFADFTLKYSDHKMQERYISFSIGDPDKVEMLKNTPLGTPLRVLWFPEATEKQGGDKWFPRLSAFNVSVIKDVPVSSPVKAEKITIPSFPEKKEPDAWKNSLTTHTLSDDLPDDSGLPF